MKPIKAWAVINIDLNEVCLTGEVESDNYDWKNKGMAIFNSRKEAIEYRKTFKGRWPNLKIIKVLIKPVE